MSRLKQCRICCKSDASAMIRLSDRTFDGRSTAQVIEDCFGLKVSENELSSMCCVRCKSDLLIALKLVTRIRESDIELQSILAIPKVEIDSPSIENISTIFIDETDIKSEVSDERSEIPAEAALSIPHTNASSKLPPKRRGRPRKKSIASNIEENTVEKAPPITLEKSSEEEISGIKLRRMSTHSLRSDDGISASSSDSEDSDFEPDDHVDLDEPQERKRVSYGVKPDSIPKRCCGCKNFPLDSHDKVREHSEKFHTKKQNAGQNDNDEKGFECRVCFAQFEHKKLFLQHRRKMYVDVLHPCKQCEEEFANFYVLQNHMKHNHQRKLKIQELEEMRIQSNICCGCRVKFNSQEELKEHAIKVHLPQREHNDGENSVECDVCFKSYKSAKYLKDHRLRFFKKKNLICTQCGKSFRERSQLEGHEDSHRNFRKYECPICHAKFSMKASWQVHVKYHDAKEAFHCEYCGKGFRKKGLMKAHLRIHSTDRPHKCSICPLTFTQKNRLNSHMLEHSGLKSFKCSQCSASYIHQRALRRHFRDKHEGIQSFKCTICPKGFVELKPLLVHLKTHERSSEATFSKI